MPLILFNKPFRVLSQFTDAEGRPTLADFITEKHVYAAGRLDYDSEGLLLLTDDGRLQAQISNPRTRIQKWYWVQVEGEPDSGQLEQLTSAVRLKDGHARALAAMPIEEPRIRPRMPPIRVRKSIPTSWLEVVLDQGRNRQVRRMTAAVGLPTLRLVRHRIGNWELEDLLPGEWRGITNATARNMLDAVRKK